MLDAMETATAATTETKTGGGSVDHAAQREATIRPDLTRATSLTGGIADEIARQYTYMPWSQEQTKCGLAVREVLIKAVAVVITNVPPGPDRTVALRKLREARMDCNAAISLGT